MSDNGNIFGVLDRALHDPFDKAPRGKPEAVPCDEDPQTPASDYYHGILPRWVWMIGFSVVALCAFLVVNFVITDDEPEVARSAPAFVSEDDKPKDDPKPNVQKLGQDIYEAGYKTAELKTQTKELERQTKELERQTKEAKEEFAGLGKVVLFIECLERRTGKKIRGNNGSLERHMHGKHGRACKKELDGKTNDEVISETQQAVDAMKARDAAAAG